MKIVTAIDSFKGSMTSMEAGLAVTEGIHRVDSDVDVQTAHNAGLPCIGVTWGFRSKGVLEEAGADFLVDTPEQLLEIVMGQKGD